MSINHADKGLIILTSIENDGLYAPARYYERCHHDNQTYKNLTFSFYQCQFIIDANIPILTDLSINVNFSALAGLEQFYNRRQLPLLIGLSNNLIDDYTHTVPVTIIPGVNMAASYIWGIRQIYTNGILAALGMFEVSMWFY